MTDRTKRYIAFDKFQESVKVLFKSHADSTPDSERLDNLYSFCICPGGRNGGTNKKEVEIFYGNRPFDSVTEIGTNFELTKKCETAHGATLSYTRTDDGQVLCTLRPAASENFHHPEDFIFLGIIKNPADLEGKSKRHWKMFLAYMESTCLDGKPSFLQKIVVFYLRNFKECVVKKTLQKRRASVFFGEIAKYTITVGLSGFIILLVTWAKNSTDSVLVNERHQEVLSIYSNIESNAQLIAEFSQAIESNMKILNQNTSKNLQALNVSISESTAQIVHAVSELEKISETKADQAPNVAE